METSEFDQYADSYYRDHSRNISASGEEPEFFADYKIADTRRLTMGRRVSRILDFGSGIGNSIPFFRAYFPESYVVCADTSRRSLDIAAQRFPGPEHRLVIKDGVGLDVEDRYFDLCFAACVFHHIPHDRHRFWLGELSRVTAPWGMLIIFEHNPLNPVTRAVVRACPFDVDARLIAAGRLAQEMRSQGWTHLRCEYRIFFPRMLARLRPLERLLTSVPLGAQYSLSSINAA